MITILLVVLIGASIFSLAWVLSKTTDITPYSYLDLIFKRRVK